MTEIKIGDYVIFIDSKGKKWLVKIEKDKVFSTHHGKININDIIGLKYGSSIETHLNRKLYLLKPTIFDIILKLKRKTQIVYPKDIGYMIMKLGIKPDSRILEIGTGSGAITLALTQILKNGKIDTYERREDIVKIAKKNIKNFGENKAIELHDQDFTEADITPEEYDAAIIDIEAPWTVIPKVHKALKPGCYIAIIIPTYNQLDKLIDILKEYFIDIEANEMFYRTLQTKKGAIRPKFRMIGYTTMILTAAKKII